MSLWKSTGRRPRQVSRARPCCPRLEMLERRWVPATLTPTTFADGGPGSGSLRDAVLQLNADTGTDDDIIQLEAGTYTLTIPNVGGRHETAGLTGDLNLTQTSHRWIIQGAGPSTIIDASQLQDRVFQIVNPGTQVVFQDLVIQGGLAQDDGTDGALAGTTDALGGGIFNRGGDLTLDDVVVQNNLARGADVVALSTPGHHGLGGGIYSTAGALTIAGATIANNQASGGHGGDYNGNNSAGDGGSAAGGGLYASAGSLDISDSMVARNRATGGQGGDGIYACFSGSCTYLDGGAGGSALGAGLYVNGGSLTLASSTIASNQGGAGSPGVGGYPGLGEGGGLLIQSQTGMLAITGSTLSGNSTTGDGGGGGISNWGTLTVSNSTLSANSAYQGGGMYNLGTLTVSNSTLSGNSAYQGGGIYNEGTLTVSNSTLSGNSAPNGGGGGIYNFFGRLTVSNSTLSGNSAPGQFPNGGGGIYNYGTLTVSNSTLSANSAGGFGGGIRNLGTLTVSNSTLSANSAIFSGVYGDGGGISNEGGTLTVSNSTLSGNSAPNGGGGGIYNTGQFGGAGALTVTSSTLSGNSANTGGGIDNFGAYASTVSRNTLVAGNTAATSPDLSGTFTSQGHNLIGDGTGGSGFNVTDLVGTAASPIDPRLGPLQDNGGPTPTMALLPGSPAIDAGDNTGAPMWDQRGAPFRRIVNGIIDIGAFEVQARGHGGPNRQPLPDPVPVQALGMVAGPLAGQPPDLPANPFPVTELGGSDGQTGESEPLPVPTAGGQQAPATLVGTYPGTEWLLASLGASSVNELDALALNMLGGT